MIVEWLKGLARIEHAKVMCAVCGKQIMRIEDLFLQRIGPAQPMHIVCRDEELKIEAAHKDAIGRVLFGTDAADGAK